MSEIEGHCERFGVQTLHLTTLYCLEASFDLSFVNLSLLFVQLFVYVTLSSETDSKHFHQSSGNII